MLVLLQKEDQDEGNPQGVVPLDPGDGRVQQHAGDDAGGDADEGAHGPVHLLALEQQGDGEVSQRYDPQGHLEERLFGEDADLAAVGGQAGEDEGEHTLDDQICVCLEIGHNASWVGKIVKVHLDFFGIVP